MSARYKYADIGAKAAHSITCSWPRRSHFDSEFFACASHILAICSLACENSKQGSLPDPFRR